MAVKKKIRPTSRTYAECRARGIVCDRVEFWNQYAGKFGLREDLFGFLDIIALDPARGIVGIQACGPGEFAAHKRKILANEHAPLWLKCSGKIEIWCWRKLLKKRGGKARYWSPRIEEITIDMFV